MEISTLMTFLGIAVLLTLAPGPDVMYLLAKSLSGGSRQGITLAAGLSTGPIFHTALVMAGVAALIQSSPAAFRALTYVGAAYLLYLAWGAFRAKPEPLKIEGGSDEFNSFALYRRGILMNVLNPKVLLFFLALFPQFIKPGGFPPAVQIGILGLTFSVQAFCVFSLIALCAGKIRDHLVQFQNFPRIMNLVEAAILLFIAVGLLFM